VQFVHDDDDDNNNANDVNVDDDDCVSETTPTVTLSLIGIILAPHGPSLGHTFSRMPYTEATSVSQKRGHGCTTGVFDGFYCHDGLTKKPSLSSD
jgi:hypothetical protein